MAAEYTIRRKMFSLLATEFHIFDTAGNVIGFSRQKAFKLKEDIRVYRDESMETEFLTISARQIMDFSAAYDIVESKTGKRLGALQRKGLASMFRDTWIVLDTSGEQYGTIEEDNPWLALVRRISNLTAMLIPQAYSLKGADGAVLAEFQTHMNPFVRKLTVRVPDQSPLHRGLPLAAGVLLVAIEGRQG